MLNHLTEARNKINRLKRRYFALRGIEILFLSVGVALFVWAILSLLTPSLAVRLTTAIALGLAVAVKRTLRYQLFRLDNNRFVRYLNARYPSLEESADLLLQDPDSMSALQRLQLEKTGQRFDALYPEIKLPQALPQSLGVFAVGLVAYVGLTSFIAQPNASTPKKSIDVASLSSQPMPASAAVIHSLSITVTPPSYTGIKSFGSETPQLVVPEGSTVSWEVAFSSRVREVKLLLSGKDSVNLAFNKGTYSTRQKLTEPGFYQLQWRDGQKIARSDYFKIEIIKDQSPKLTVDNLNQFTRLTNTDRLSVSLQSTLTDDYGLASATIVATVSKGSGESVKFREERLRFDKPTSISGKRVNAALTMDLRKMGMEPGDELYFYVEALDNKTPGPNYSRTETFFVALPDTSTQVAVEDEGLGVDVMPEYFRSQRQIIIDTEKLLKERKNKTVQEFKSTSNELGYDQKVLRLRYGQFLGEEFQGQIGPGSVDHNHDGHEEKIEDVAKSFGHAHDKENEHHMVPEKKAEPMGHSHEGELKDPNAKENPLEAYVHNHDTGEESTFFVQSVRAKLKAALTVMWDAELQLRLYEPKKSLPYQYIALKLLKEISNDSRIYVHRTGFDPPPLKEEKRLTADLDEVRNSTGRNEQVTKEKYPEIGKALQLIEQLLDRNKNALSTANREQFHRAGQELASVALEQPGKFLPGLSLLKKVTDEKVEKAKLSEWLLRIRSVFWKVLPQQPVSPARKSLMTHRLDQQFLKSLEELPHE